MDRVGFFMNILRDNDNYFRNIYNIFIAYNTITEDTNNIFIVCYDYFNDTDLGFTDFLAYFVYLGKKLQ